MNDFGLHVEDRTAADRFVGIVSTVPASNPSGITPTEFRVLVLPKPVEEKTAGGIILSDTTKEHEKHLCVEGTIIAVSPHAFTYAKPEEWAAVNAEKPKPGDRVMYAKHNGQRVKGQDKVEYLVIKDTDVIATIGD